MANLSESIGNVSRSIREMRHYQKFKGMTWKKDWYLALDNFNYVTRRSIGQVILVIICAIVQIVFIKKLFDYPSNSKAGV